MSESPILLWCWKCPACGHAEIMEVIASTECAASVLTCDKCERQTSVYMPHND